MTHAVPLYIDGSFIPSTTESWMKIVDPANQELVTQVPCATSRELEMAVAGARKAFGVWRTSPLKSRLGFLVRFHELLRKEEDRLVRLLAKETGKVLADARGELQRGMEVVEHALALPTLLLGESMMHGGIQLNSYLEPLGVCLGITPFNFPAMIPLWMFPLAIACGNSFVLKPSEQDPLSTMALVELTKEAGLPDGVLQVVHGGREQVEALIAHPDIAAVSFVGSATVARAVYRLAGIHGKRVQALAGAKNHAVILPDAPHDETIRAIAGAGCGAAGQRCMAISVAILVGDQADDMALRLREAMAELHPGPYDDPDASFGPLISRSAKERFGRLVASAYQEGAVVLLDGSQAMVPGRETGNWVGATLVDQVTEAMAVYREEVFGPVVCLLRASSLDEAIAIINRNPYGNGTAIFTSSGAAAQHFCRNVDVGNVGINVPIPVPLAFFSFTGRRGSFHGDLHACGKEAIRFYTQAKTVTSRWLGEQEFAGSYLTHIGAPPS